MLGFCTYNFCFDKNALDPMLTCNLKDLNDTRIENGIFNHVNITSDTLLQYTKDIPTKWDFDTILDANLNGELNGGNIDDMLARASAIRIKRREVGDFNWITLKEIPISIMKDFDFTLNDILNENGVEYEYAFVPIIDGNEGKYITETVFSQFNGVFLCDLTTFYRFYSRVSYGDTTSVQKVGVFEPTGSKYPIVIMNSETSYKQGSVTGLVVNDSFYNDGRIDREETVKKRNLLDKFLKNKRAKILKDWNGNFILVMIIGNPITSFDNSYGMGTVSTSFEWVEQGDPKNADDLYYSGLVEVIE